MTIEMMEWRYSLKKAIFLNKWATSRIVLRILFAILDTRDLVLAADISNKRILAESYTLRHSPGYPREPKVLCKRGYLAHYLRESMVCLRAEAKNLLE